MNARLEFVGDPSETPDIPSQEFGVRFADTDGNLTQAFLPGVQLSDISSCEGPVALPRSGLFRKRAYDCGAQALKLYELRQRLNKRSK